MINKSVTPRFTDHDHILTTASDNSYAIILWHSSL